MNIRYGVKLTPAYKNWRGKQHWYASLMKLNPETDEWEKVRKYEEVEDGYFVAFGGKNTEKLIQKCKKHILDHQEEVRLTRMVELGEFECSLPSTSF